MTENSTHPMGKIKTIALATDGSVYTDGAVQEAIFFAQACGASLVVLNVIGIDTGIASQATGAYASAATVRAETQKYIENITKMAADNGIECEVIVEESYQPDKAIIELARKHKADVIVMGRHGKRGVLQLLVGSMTSKIIGRGFPRVQVVPKDATIFGEKILLATDGSEFSQIAVDETISMGENCTTLKEIYVLSVAAKETDKDAAGKCAEEACAQMRGKIGKVECVGMGLVGRAAEVITTIAQEKNVDLIVMGGRGKGLTKLLMGHVTEKVIGRSHCAVLVVEKDL
jgi:nucleotide-binding universal stress UspA family protein